MRSFVMGSAGVLLACVAPTQPRTLEALDIAHEASPSAPSTATPAGRWVLEPLDDSGCIDCPTPHVAVVVARGSAEDMRDRGDELGAMPPGYPMLLIASELGLSTPVGDEANSPEVLLVAAMFASKPEAEAWLGSTAMNAELHEIRWAGASPDRFVVQTRREARGYEDAAVRETDGNPRPGAARCSLPPGHVELLGPDAVYEPADNNPWVRLRCGEGSAMFRAADTDYGLIVRAEGEGRVELQDAGGVCGTQFFDRHAFDGSGQLVGEAQSRTTRRCFGEPDGDSWGRCPGGTLETCTQRAQILHADGTDLLRAARLAAYACEWGSEAACPLRWRVDLDRGVAAAEVLSSAVAHCPLDADNIDLTSEACVAIDELLRELGVHSLRGATDSMLGPVARHGCLRELPGWCDVLETSASCDLDGCG